MTSDLRGSRNDRRWHWRRERNNITSGTVSSNIVLVGSELSSFGRDSLEILLSRGIGVADLEKKTLLANGLAMELLDDLLADITRLEAIEMVSLYSSWLSKGLLTERNQHHDCCSGCREGFYLN